MSLFTKSLIILLAAISTPLLYRQFSNENTVKFMSTYYSNYKSIDQFLRQSAAHLDLTKDALLNSDQLRNAVSTLKKQVDRIINTNKLSRDAEKLREKNAASEKEPMKHETKSEERIVQCPNEDLGESRVRLWRKQELAAYDGKSKGSKVYLAFLGLVYDVTENQQHYGEGADYNAFTGRDATRAFVTGNFTHDLHDDISDLEDSMFSHIESWASFYNSNYPIAGRLEGSFYDSKGCATKELAKVHETLKSLKEVEAIRQARDAELPECNSEWNSDLKRGRVWCSTRSGGVERSWAGVPRIYDDNESKRCVCVNEERTNLEHLEKYLSTYPNCDSKSYECFLAQS